MTSRGQSRQSKLAAPGRDASLHQWMALGLYAVAFLLVLLLVVGA